MILLTAPVMPVLFFLFTCKTKIYLLWIKRVELLLSGSFTDITPFLSKPADAMPGEFFPGAASY